MPTVPPIDEPLVAALIANQFPHWADLPLRKVPVDGWDNRSFRLGEAMLVRLPSAARYAGQVARAARCRSGCRPR
jgi:aminoglycoside phosphotransferase (APT) family kinase protein